MKSLLKKYGLYYLLITPVSCKKIVDVSPPVTQLVSATVYSSDATAAAAVTGIYQTMVSNSIAGGNTGISALLGLSSDELKLFPTTNVVLNQAYRNELLSNTNIPFWSQFYNCIYQANLALERIPNSNGVTTAMKNQLIGESKFVRAFCNFYLINIFGNIPLITSTDFKINSVIVQSQKSTLCDQIIADLIDAKALLTDTYLTPTGVTATERVRPNRATATSLLARVYLYLQKWSEAEAESSLVINNNGYKLETNLNNVFLATNNKEAIWQLESLNNGSNAPDGGTFLSGYNGSSRPRSAAPFLLSDSLVNNFESGDLRKINWVVKKVVSSITYYYPYKYKLSITNLPPTEYTVLFRLAEQFLIRAEARAQQGNLDGGKADLNIIRTRAGLGNTSAINQQNLLAAIQIERRFELFTEYGHRWLDLIRTNGLNTYMSVVTPNKGGVWQSTDQLYPIPSVEIIRDPNLTQNPGYQ
jgi:hypothetical protein